MAEQTFGPYSPWRRAGDFVIISGQLGVAPGTSEFVGASAAEQLRQALQNAKAVLAEVKGTLFLISMDDFAACNEVWIEFFATPRPTRSAVAVAQLPLNARAEVELWAYAPQA
jgi:2-iminobutanoate/2-iminopropanoate deaminase